jgi:hypothetical protein
MNEKQAEALARALGGEAWNSGGSIWLVQLHVGRKLVVFSGDCVCEYESEDAFDEGRASKTIHLEDQDALGADRWVIVGPTGAVMYENDEFELGWQDEHEALTAARGLASRGEGRWQVVRQDEVKA